MVTKIARFEKFCHILKKAFVLSMVMQDILGLSLLPLGWSSYKLKSREKRDPVNWTTFSAPYIMWVDSDFCEENSKLWAAKRKERLAVILQQF